MSTHKKPQSSYQSYLPIWKTLASNKVSSSSNLRLKTFGVQESKYSEKGNTFIKSPRSVIMVSSSLAQIHDKKLDQLKYKHNSFKTNKKINEVQSQYEPEAKLSYTFADLGKKRMSIYEATSQTGSSFAYCEKCTIKLAAQGYHVKRLQHNQNYNYEQRQQSEEEISQYKSHQYPCECSAQGQDKYLSDLSTKYNSAKECQQSASQIYFDLQQIKRQILTHKASIEQNIRQYQSKFQTQLSQIDNYFSAIVAQILLIKSQYEKELLNRKEQLSMSNNRWKQIFRDIAEEIDISKKGLQDNIRDYGYMRIKKEIHQNIDEFKRIKEEYQTTWHNNTKTKIIQKQYRNIPLVKIEEAIQILKELLSNLPPITPNHQQTFSSNNYSNLQKYLYFSKSEHPSQIKKSQFMEQSILLD